jgi:hypothetical protein
LDRPQFLRYGQLDPEQRREIDELSQEINRGVTYYRQIERAIAEWRRAILTGAAEFSEEAELRAKTDLNEWLEVTKGHLDAIRNLEGKFGCGCVPGSIDLEICSWGAERMLKDWYRPAVTACQGLREQELSEEEATRLLESFRDETARPGREPERIRPDT